MEIYREILWTIHNSQGKKETDITALGNPVNGFKERFATNYTSTGERKLIIKDVRSADSQIYYCINDEGQGKRMLIVLLVGKYKQYYNAQAHPF